MPLTYFLATSLGRKLTQDKTEKNQMPRQWVQMGMFCCVYAVPDQVIIVLIQTLTNGTAKVKKSIEGLEYKRGFTNMAQTFTMAETMFLLGGRKKAMSAVLTLTDGKPSFPFNACEKVLQLKDKYVKLFFTPVTEFAGEELALMKKWASSPWETNLAHAPWLMPLNDDSALSVQEMVVKFFPEAMSLSSMMIEEAEMDHTLIAGNNHCETWPIPSIS